MQPTLQYLICGATSELAIALIKLLDPSITFTLVARDTDKLQHIAQTLGNITTTHTCDLADDTAVKTLIKQLKSSKTKFDGVFCAAGAHAMLPLRDARMVLYQHFLELDGRVKQAARQDDVCMRMMTVPGVGPIAALTFKAAVDAPARFQRSRTVAAHFGLTPRRYQSGEQDNLGRISKAGDRDVRSTLYAAANALLMRTMAGSQIKSWGMRLMRTKGRRRAVVAVARKLAVLLHRMWADGTVFRSEKSEGSA